MWWEIKKYEVCYDSSATLLPYNLVTIHLTKTKAKGQCVNGIDKWQSWLGYKAQKEIAVNLSGSKPTLLSTIVIRSKVFFLFNTLFFLCVCHHTRVGRRKKTVNSKLDAARFTVRSRQLCSYESPKNPVSKIEIQSITVPRGCRTKYCDRLYPSLVLSFSASLSIFGKWGNGIWPRHTPVSPGAAPEMCCEIFNGDFPSPSGTPLVRRSHRAIAVPHIFSFPELPSLYACTSTNCIIKCEPHSLSMPWFYGKSVNEIIHLYSPLLREIYLDIISFAIGRSSRKLGINVNYSGNSTFSFDIICMWWESKKGRHISKISFRISELKTFRIVHTAFTSKCRTTRNSKIYWK